MTMTTSGPADHLGSRLAMARRRRGRTTLGIALALACAASGCRKADQGSKDGKKGPASPPPQLALRPAAEARPDLVAEVVAPNLDHSFTAVAEVAAKLGLPSSAQDLRRALLSNKGAPPQAFDELDLGRPVALTVVAAAPATVGKSYILMTIALKDPTASGFNRWLDRWATVKERDADAVSVASRQGDAGAAADAADRPSGTWAGWMLHRDGAICVGHDRQALVAGCALALQARRAPAGDAAGGEAEHLRATLVPEGIARAQGTTLGEALGRLRDQIRAAQPVPAAAARGQTAPPPPASVALDRFVQSLEEVATVRAGLALDLRRGFALRTLVTARPGSALAKTLAERHPFAVDPRLFEGPTPAMLFALGSTAALWDSLALAAAATESQASSAGGKRRPSPIPAAIATLRETLSGPASGRGRFVEGPRPELRYDLVYQLKSGSDPGQVMAAWQQATGSDWLARAVAGGAGKLKVKVNARREGATVVTRMTVDPRSLPHEARNLAGIPPFDGRPFEARAQVDGERLLVTTGPDGRAALEALRQPPPAAPPGAGPPPGGALGPALAEAAGEDGFYFLDLAAIIRSAVTWAEIGARSADGRAAAGPLAAAGQARALLANVELATWASHRSGPDLTFRWRLPLSTLESMAGIVRQSLGLLTGGLFTPPPAR